MKCSYICLAVAVGLSLLGGGSPEAARPARDTKSESASPTATQEAAAVVKRIKQLGGTIKRDNRGRIVEVNLKSCQATDRDVARTDRHRSACSRMSRETQYSNCPVD